MNLINTKANLLIDFTKDFPEHHKQDFFKKILDYVLQADNDITSNTNLVLANFSGPIELEAGLIPDLSIYKLIDFLNQFPKLQKIVVKNIQIIAYPNAFFMFLSNLNHIREIDLRELQCEVNPEFDYTMLKLLSNVKLVELSPSLKSLLLERLRYQFEALINTCLTDFSSEPHQELSRVYDNKIQGWPNQGYFKKLYDLSEKLKVFDGTFDLPIGKKHPVTEFCEKVVSVYSTDQVRG